MTEVPTHGSDSSNIGTTAEDHSADLSHPSAASTPSSANSVNMSSTWKSMFASSGSSKQPSSLPTHTGQTGRGDAQPTTPADGEEAIQEVLSWFETSSSEQSSVFRLSRTQRLIAFTLCSFGAIFCLTMAWLLLPLLAIKARKVAALFSLGSLLILVALAVLRGPATFFGSLVTSSYAHITALYVASLALTVYAAMGRRSTLMTIPCAALQVLALAMLISTTIPGGLTGVKLLLKVSWYTTKKVTYPVAKSLAGRIISV